MKKYIYDILVCILAIISVAFAVYDFTKGLLPWMQTADMIIYIIFVVDYIVRFFVSQSKVYFVKNNMFDLIAILPFNSALRIFRVAKITKLARLSKLSKITKATKLVRVGSVGARLLKRTKRFLNTNGFKYMIMLCIICIILGTVGIMYFENMSFQDALWWSFVTATTVGYGDLSPVTNAGRIIASALMLVGIGLIGSLTSSITTFFMQDKQGDTVDNTKIDMVLTLYNTLNETEKQSFFQYIKKELPDQDYQNAKGQ